MQNLPIPFLFLSFLTILSALYVVTSKNPVHSVLALIFTFFTISAHYVLLNAQFLAVVNLIVYAGAIMVLFLFVLMLLNLSKETEPVKSNWWGIAAPAGTPQPIIDRLAKEIDAVLRSPETQKQFASDGVETIHKGPAEFGKFLNAEIDKWGKAIRSAGIPIQQ